MFLKFKRLEQLIFCLRRRLAQVELHGAHPSVLARYGQGGVDQLLDTVKRLKEVCQRNASQHSTAQHSTAAQRHCTSHIKSQRITSHI